MPAVNQDVIMWAGDTKVIRIAVKDAAGVAVPLTGATVRWWMARNTYAVDENIFVVKATGGDGIVITGAPGEFDITLLPEDTDLVPPGVYYHEAEVREADGTVSTVTVGKFTLKASLIPSV